MSAPCPVCGAEFLAESGIELSGPKPGVRVCSARCAEAQAGAAAPLASVPALPSRVLVAVDGSGPSLRAVALAAALARAADGEVMLLAAADVRLVRALDMVSGARRSVDLGLDPAEIERTLREDAAAQLSGAEQICRDAGVRHRKRVALSTPLEAIRAAATQADLVVMGSRGLGAVSGALLGSLSHRVIGACEVPVLVVH